MKLLHTVNRPELLNLALRTARSGDTLLLLEDGVYSGFDDRLEAVETGIIVLALQEDLEARGLASRIARRVTAVTTDEFVQLCCDHARVINWF